MLASFNRYTFQPHHFVLAHDVVLDNVEQNLETNGERNFECNKENDTQNFTWDFPVNSSNLFHSSNTSLESLNMKNAVKSKLGSRKLLLQDQIKKHKVETAEMMCSLRIEDFAKIGTDCVKLDLDSIVGRKNAKKPNSLRPPTSTTRLVLDDLDQAIDQAMVQFEKTQQTANSTTHSASSHRVSRKLPEIPKNQIRDSALRLSQDPVPVSSLMRRTPSLAEELKAALMAESLSCLEGGKDGEEEALVNSFPKGFHLDLDHYNDDDDELSAAIDLSDLGSPEQIDPVKKYGDMFSERISGEKNKKTCRKSCCLSDAVPIGRVSEKGPKDIAAAAAAAPGGATVGRSSMNAECQSDTAEKDSSVSSGRVSTSEAGCGDDVPMDPDCQSVEELRSLSSVSGHGASEEESKSSAKETEQPKDKSFPGNDQGQQNTACNTAFGKRTVRSGSSGSSSSAECDLDEIDATHRGCHKFIPRHPGELAIEIGDFIYVQAEDDDLWCEGINLRTKQRGIFPTAYAMDLSLLSDDSRGSKYFVKFLGSIEVGFHKGNDVLCQAINKLVAARRRTAESNPPPLCCLEITEHGVKMTDRSKKKPTVISVSKAVTAVNEKCPTENDHLFLLKNISFCGYHPKDEKYLGFITKHPLEMRFACHVFQSDKSTKVVAEAIGDAFRKFYQEYLAFVYPTEDIYLE